MSADRKAIEARLARLTKSGGGVLTPDAVVDDARNPSSPLHDSFEWNDGVAAHQYRIEQARALIRSVRLEITTETRVISTVRYVRDPKSKHDEQGYADVAVLRTDADHAADALHDELTRVRALFARCESLAEAFDMKNDVVELSERVSGLQRRITARRKPRGGEDRAAA